MTELVQMRRESFRRKRRQCDLFFAHNHLIVVALISACKHVVVIMDNCNCVTR